jgi:hypothetical protein
MRDHAKENLIGITTRFQLIYFVYSKCKITMFFTTMLPKLDYNSK